MTTTNNTAPIQSAELAELKRLAERADSEEWNADKSYGVVYGSDGDSVCLCHDNIGAMPEPIWAADRALFIAAANPATILRLLDALAAPSPAQQASSDLMPKRAAFIAWCKGRGLDTDVEKDAWGAHIFKHSHIQAMWEGWFNAPVVQEQAKSTDSIRGHADFREDLERLSQPGLSKAQAKVIRKAIYDTIDARVRNLAAAQEAKPTDISALLREYAGNPGYSHGDYAGTMLQAADELDRLAAAPTPAARGLTDLWIENQRVKSCLVGGETNIDIIRHFARAIEAHLSGNTTAEGE